VEFVTLSTLCDPHTGSTFVTVATNPDLEVVASERNFTQRKLLDDLTAAGAVLPQ
jgi:hypothetical protein